MKQVNEYEQATLELHETFIRRRGEVFGLSLFYIPETSTHSSPHFAVILTDTKNSNTEVFSFGEVSLRSNDESENEAYYLQIEQIMQGVHRVLCVRDSAESIKYNV